MKTEAKAQTNGASEAAKAQFGVVALPFLQETKNNPRKHFANDALDDLTKSVKEKGVLVPLLVRPSWSKIDGSDQEYEILAGARRFRAAKAAGLKEVPVLIRELDDEAALEVTVIENLQREDVHPLEEAEGFKLLLAKGKYDVKSLAAKVAKSQSYVYQSLKLVELSEDGKKLFLEGKMTAGHAVQLARLQANDQKKAIKENGPTSWRDEFVSVRELGDWIKRNVHLVLSKAGFPLDDEGKPGTAGIKSSALAPGAKACVLCPKRTGANPQLFSDVDSKDICTDPACFHAKEQAFVRIELEMFSGAKMLSAGDFYGQTKPKGLTNWTPVKNECKHTVSGVVVQLASYYNGNEKLGSYHPRVCTNQACAVHNKKERSGHTSNYVAPRETAAQKAKREEANRKQELHERADRKALTLLAEKIKQPGREELAFLSASAVMQGDSEGGEILAVTGWKSMPSYMSAPKMIAKLSEAQLGKLLVVLAYSDSFYNGDKFARETFAAKCAKHKIDRKAIYAELDAASKPQTSAKAAKPAKKTAKKAA